MSIFQICGVAVICAAAIAILKVYKSELVFPVAAVASVSLLGSALSAAIPVAEYAKSISDASGFSVYFYAIMKALGVGIIAETASSVCRDCGQPTLASRVEFAAKILILLISLPMIKQIVEMALEVVK